MRCLAEVCRLSICEPFVEGLLAYRNMCRTQHTFDSDEIVASFQYVAAFVREVENPGTLGELMSITIRESSLFISLARKL